MEKELLLLGLLRGQDMHGYQLAEIIAHNLSTCTDLKKSTAYFLLEKMCKTGWIKYENAQSGHRPMRRVYHITQEGEKVFQQLLRENLATYSRPFFPNDVGLAFLDNLDPSEIYALTLQKRANVEIQRQELAAAALYHPGFTHWMLDHQIQHMENELAWLDELIRHLQQNPGSDPSAATASNNSPILT
jgi:DNA-binding PadR family transcriptional regulator